MSGAYFDSHRKLLDHWQEISLQRRLISNAGIDFSSNDYLGLAKSQLLRDAAIKILNSGIALGSGGSRLLAGNTASHESLEAKAAEFFACESVLSFANGFQANQALFSTLPQTGDIILYDELIHASVHDGMRLSRAESRPFLHNNLEAARDTLKELRQNNFLGQIWIAIEALYSMDGDIAPLADFLALAEEFEAYLIVDEAHSTGLFGQQGRGLAHKFAKSENVLVLHTCGKALGCSGALLGMPNIAKDFMINKSRNFIFSTAPSPFNAKLIESTLELLQSRPEIIEETWKLIRFAHKQAQSLSVDHLESQIIPIVIGDDEHTMQIAKSLQDKGFDIRGIRPPTVPKGTARLRVSINGGLTKAEISLAFSAIKELKGEQSWPL